MLEQRLNVYKKEKAFVEATMLRIQRLREMLNEVDDDSLALIFDESKPKETGMPKSSKISNIPEQSCIQKENCKETIEKWICDDQNRIALVRLEVEQIDTSLKGLTAEENYVIEKKYFEKWSWGKIEQGINTELRPHHCDGYIGESGLKKVNRRALNKLDSILGKFYKRLARSI